MYVIMRARISNIDVILSQSADKMLSLEYINLPLQLITNCSATYYLDIYHIS